MNISSELSAYTWGEVVYKAQSIFGPRRQRHFQLVLIHRGEVVIEVDGREVLVREGEVALLVPNRTELFRFAPDRPTHHSWIDAKFEGRAPLWPSLLDVATVTLPIGERLEWLIRDLLSRGKPTDLMERGLCGALAEAGFYDVFVRAGLTLEEPSPRHPSVQRALNIMNNHYRESLPLAELGRKCGISPQHLSRVFTDETGCSPIRYLWKIREDEGRRMLRETGLTIGEISEACGFQNPFHFTRRMRQRFGHPPRVLRKRDWRVAS